MFIKPAPGLKVLDHVTKKFIPDSGFEVDANDFYWARRLGDGDVFKTAPAITVTTKEAK